MKKYTAWILALLFYATSLVWNVNPSISDGWKVNLDDNTVLMEHLKVGNPSEATTSSGGHVGHKIPRYWDDNAFSDNLTLYGKAVVGDNTGSIDGYTFVRIIATG